MTQYGGRANPLPYPCNGSVGGEKDRFYKDGFKCVRAYKAATPLASMWTNQTLQGSDDVAYVGHDWHNLSEDAS